MRHDMSKPMKNMFEHVSNMWPCAICSLEYGLYWSYRGVRLCQEKSITTKNEPDKEAILLSQNSDLIFCHVLNLVVNSCHTTLTQYMMCAMFCNADLVPFPQCFVAGPWNEQCWATRGQCLYRCIVHRHIWFAYLHVLGGKQAWGIWATAKGQILHRLGTHEKLLHFDII